MNELTLERERRTWSEQIIVEPSRLSSGLWGEAEGDIAAAYCADTLPKAKAFIQDGQLFTNTCNSAMLTQSGDWQESVHGYPLIAEADYCRPEPQGHCYEGRTAFYKGRRYRLGCLVRFVCRARTVEEWADLLRHQFAHGGYFAAGKTYAEVLVYFRQHGRLPVNKFGAIATELRRDDLPKTQAQMLASFESASEKKIIRATPQRQMELELML